MKDAPPGDVELPPLEPPKILGLGLGVEEPNPPNPPVVLAAAPPKEVG